jgi:high-affinity iron transporter
LIVSFVITLREALEAALIVGIVLALLARMDKRKQFKQVYYGILVAVIVSVVFALIFQYIAGGISEQNEALFEGVTTLLAAALLTTMIIWMERKAPKIEKDIEQKVETAVQSPSFGIFLIIFVAVLREGVETVLFLFGIPAEDGGLWLGAILGFLTAILIAVVYFMGSKRFGLRTFFRVTTILLVIFAAGMVAYGIHELQEANVLPTLVEHLWDINHILDENSPLGQILKGLIGYNGNPSLIEVIAYISYLTIMVTSLVIRRKKKPQIIQP